MDYNVKKNDSMSEANPVTNKQGSVSCNGQSATDETEINLADLLLTYIKKWFLLCAVSCACTILVFLFISKPYKLQLTVTAIIINFRNHVM